MNTRQSLVEAATRAFAEDGVFTASLVEITRRAGQRNRGAVHYHFGSREALVVAVLAQHTDFLAERETVLLARARATPDDDVVSVLEAVVRPAVELADTGTSGRDYLVIMGQLVEEYDRLDETIRDQMRRTGGYAIYDLLAERMPVTDDALHIERLALVTSFILRAIADRARAQAAPTPGRPQLPTERFVKNLVAMAARMATTPPIDG